MHRHGDAVVKAVIGLDVGNTRITAAIVRASGEVLAMIRRPTDASGGANACYRQIEDMLGQLISTASERSIPISCVGVGFGGPVDYEGGRIMRSHHVSGWEDFPLRQLLREKFGLPVVLDNDANAGALGELLFGAAKRHRNVLYVNIGTGIGGAIISDGKLVRGENNFAGEIGHIIVVRDGPICGCGKLGCLEAVASGTGIGRRATELIQLGSIKTSLPKRSVTSKEVFEAALHGDELAMVVVDEAVEHLAHGLGIAITLLNPGIVIIGGGLSEAPEKLLLEPLRERVSKYVLDIALKGLEIVNAKLRYDAGVLGAAALAILEGGVNCD
ncbi:MAG: ROK family protein [Armatimonadota bacterium]|nr:ROK family protein [Armatimonadota bacterium]MCX7777235.1 ROK family protein [Armatimonadota bacterium]MDW8024650.1 ROK family protein [Armatimonadota bacterium]